MGKILIIANARYKGGISGSDAIYENFIKYWGCDFHVQTMLEIDYKSFWLCYAHRILYACIRSFFDFRHYDVVYSASDFLPDTLPAIILRLKGNRWIAGFYLEAFKENRLHLFTQRFVKLMIKKFADMVIVTNPTMYHIFPNKKKTWINGGVDLSLAGLSNEPKIYDAVFCGRIHPSKGIDELIDIWGLVRKQKPDATLAIIGDGDLGIEYIVNRIGWYNFFEGDDLGITLFGYMGNERYDIYKQSKIVLYPTPLKYHHFSMAPVEAMACGCPMIAFDLPEMEYFKSKGALLCNNITDFVYKILSIIEETDEDKKNKFIDEYGNSKSLKELKYEAFDWAQQFDYKRQVTRVYADIHKELKL